MVKKKKSKKFTKVVYSKFENFIEKKKAYRRRKTKERRKIIKRINPVEKINKKQTNKNRFFTKK